MLLIQMCNIFFYTRYVFEKHFMVWGKKELTTNLQVHYNRKYHIPLSLRGQPCYSQKNFL